MTYLILHRSLVPCDRLRIFWLRTMVRMWYLSAKQDTDIFEGKGKEDYG